MKAFILAAGLGTRLKPWTLEHPKALVPVGGVPMLQRVTDALARQGVTDFVINAHHFADQIDEWVAANRHRLSRQGVSLQVSDERAALLDTGGGVLHAESLLRSDYFVVHNVDILSNADIADLVRRHQESGADVTLLVSDRKSSRGLIFDGKSLRLRGWHNASTGQYRPEGYEPADDDVMYAFSGISVMSESVFDTMRSLELGDTFGIVDFILAAKDTLQIQAYPVADLSLIDIGKPDTLSQADNLFNQE